MNIYFDANMLKITKNANEQKKIPFKAKDLFQTPKAHNVLVMMFEIDPQSFLQEGNEEKKRSTFFLKLEFRLLPQNQIRN